MLAQVPGCNAEDLKRFDGRVMQLAAQRDASNVTSGASQNGTGTNPNSNKAGSAGNPPDRVLKTMFKKLINTFIEKDIAQRFKKEVVIKNLPTLQLLKPRHKTPSLDDTESNDIGLTSLFGPGTTGGGSSSVQQNGVTAGTTTTTTRASQSLNDNSSMSLPSQNSQQHQLANSNSTYML